MAARFGANPDPVTKDTYGSKNELTDLNTQVHNKNTPINMGEYISACSPCC